MWSQFTVSTASVHPALVSLSDANSGSLYVMTAATPGSAWALLMSKLLIRALGCGLRRTLAWSMFGKRSRIVMSSA